MQENRLDVLIIDDSGIVRTRLAEMLCKIDGVRCIGKVGNAKEGLDLVTIHKPGLVILDIRQEDRIGLDIVGEVKRISPTSVVIVLTNYPFSAYRVRCLALGADYFLDKSLEFSMVNEIATEMMLKQYWKNRDNSDLPDTSLKMAKPVKQHDAVIQSGNISRKGV